VGLPEETLKRFVPDPFAPPVSLSGTSLRLATEWLSMTTAFCKRTSLRTEC